MYSERVRTGIAAARWSRRLFPVSSRLSVCLHVKQQMHNRGICYEALDNGTYPAGDLRGRKANRRSRSRSRAAAQARLRGRVSVDIVIGDQRMRTYFDSLPSPIGPLLLTATGMGLSGVFMENHNGGPEPQPDWIHDPVRLEPVARQLREYFEGTREDFEVQLDLRGTPFQIEVWHALCRIPFGTTASYRDLAAAIGRSSAVRAVGAANGRNPVSIIVPCHRVIGADGSLTGYGGGLNRKRFLLHHEARVKSVAQPSRPMFELQPTD